jgi:hypothetical protein
MDYSECVNKDADPTGLKENNDIDSLVRRSSCDGESLNFWFCALNAWCINCTENKRMTARLAGSFKCVARG